MKKIIAIALAAIMLVATLACFAGCSGDNGKKPSDSSSSESKAADSKTEPRGSETQPGGDTAARSETDEQTEPAVETFPNHEIVPAEGEVIVSLYKPGDDITGWLDNNEGNNLSVEERAGVQTLVHVSQPTSISFKKKFTVDWSQYQRENIYIVIDIWVDDELFTDYKGSVKIKNGDKSDENGNTSENNQLNFDIVELDLQAGWNSYVLRLSDAVPDKGDDYTIADWFCMWINNLGIPYEFGIGRAEIVYNTAA